VIVPFRVPFAVAAETFTEMVVEPAPLAEDTDSQAAFATALHTHDATEVVSVVVNVVPAAGAVTLEGASVNVHGGIATAGAAWVIAIAWPATITVALRAAVVPFAPTPMESVVEPVPPATDAVAHA
jgi:hypothetical protein